MMVTRESQEFLDRFSPLKDNISTSCVIVLLIAIDVIVIVELDVWGWLYPLFYI
jgi:hypothetical protein